MKLKIYLWLVLWLTVCNSYASVTWKVWNTDYRVDTTFHAKIGPGTTQTSLYDRARYDIDGFFI